MIAHEGRSDDTAGATKYLRNGAGPNRVVDVSERVGWIAGRNVRGTDPKSIVRQCEDARAAHDRVKQRRVLQILQQFVVSWHTAKRQRKGGGFVVYEREEPTREEMEYVVDRMLEVLGLEEHPALIVKHIDTSVSHLHVQVCRIHPVSLDVWNGYFSIQKVNKLFREIEKEKGWKTPKHGNFLAKHGYAPAVSSSYPESEVGKVKAATLTLRGALRDELAADLEGANSWGTVEATLSESGLKLVPQKSGFVIAGGEVPVKLSSLSAALSRQKLEAKFDCTWKAYSEDDVFQRWDEMHATSDTSSFGDQVVNELSDNGGGLKGKVADALASSSALLKAGHFKGFESAVKEAQVDGEKLRLSMGRQGFQVGTSKVSWPLRTFSEALSKENLEKRFGQMYKAFVRSEVEAGRGDRRRLPPDVLDNLYISAKKAFGNVRKGGVNATESAEEWLSSLTGSFERQGIAVQVMHADDGKPECLILETEAGWKVALTDLGEGSGWAKFQRIYAARIASREQLVEEVTEIVEAREDWRTEAERAGQRITTAVCVGRVSGLGSQQFRSVLEEAKQKIQEFNEKDDLDDMRRRLVDLRAQTKEEFGVGAFRRMVVEAGGEYLARRAEEAASGGSNRPDSNARVNRLKRRLSTLEAHERMHRKGLKVEDQILREALDTVLGTLFGGEGGQFDSVSELATHWLREAQKSAQSAEDALKAVLEQGVSKPAAASPESAATGVERDLRRSEATTAHIVAQMRLRAAWQAICAVPRQHRSGGAVLQLGRKNSQEWVWSRAVAAEALLRSAFLGTQKDEAAPGAWKRFAEKLEKVQEGHLSIDSLLAQSNAGSAPAQQWLTLAVKKWLATRGALAGEQRRHLNMRAKYAQKAVRAALRAAFEGDAYTRYVSGGKLRHAPSEVAERLETATFDAMTLKGQPESSTRSQAKQAVSDAVFYLRLLDHFRKEVKWLGRIKKRGEEATNDIAEDERQKLDNALERLVERVQNIQVSSMQRTGQEGAQRLAEVQAKADLWLQISPDAKTFEDIYVETLSERRRARKKRPTSKETKANRSGKPREASKRNEKRGRERKSVAFKKRPLAEVLGKRVQSKPAMQRDPRAVQGERPVEMGSSAEGEPPEGEPEPDGIFSSKTFSSPAANEESPGEALGHAMLVSGEGSSAPPNEEQDRTRISQAQKLDKDRKVNSVGRGTTGQHLADDSASPAKQYPPKEATKARGPHRKERRQERSQAEQCAKEPDAHSGKVFPSEEASVSDGSASDESATGQEGAPHLSEPSKEVDEDSGFMLTRFSTATAGGDDGEKTQPSGNIDSRKAGKSVKEDFDLEIAIFLRALRRYANACAEKEAAELQAVHIEGEPCEDIAAGDGEEVVGIDVYSALLSEQRKEANMRIYNASCAARDVYLRVGAQREFLRLAAEELSRYETDAASHSSDFLAHFSDRRNERGAIPSEHVEGCLDQALSDMIDRADADPPTSEGVIMSEGMAVATYSNTRRLLQKSEPTVEKEGPSLGRQL